MGNFLAVQINVTFYLFPLALAISLVYSASRCELPEQILRRAMRLFIQIILFMAFSLGILWMLSFRL